MGRHRLATHIIISYCYIISSSWIVNCRSTREVYEVFRLKAYHGQLFYGSDCPCGLWRFLVSTTRIIQICSDRYYKSMIFYNIISYFYYLMVLNRNPTRIRSLNKCWIKSRFVLLFICRHSLWLSHIKWHTETVEHWTKISWLKFIKFYSPVLSSRLDLLKLTP